MRGREKGGKEGVKGGRWEGVKGGRKGGRWEGGCEGRKGERVRRRRKVRERKER